jgi:hypothetical protein
MVGKPCHHCVEKRLSTHRYEKWPPGEVERKQLTYIPCFGGFGTPVGEKTASGTRSERRETQNKTAPFERIATTGILEGREIDIFSRAGTQRTR